MAKNSQNMTYEILRYNNTEINIKHKRKIYHHQKETIETCEIGEQKKIQKKTLTEIGGLKT